LSYGVEWFFVSRTVPREIRVAYVEDGSPGTTAGLLRGDTIVSIDGVSTNATTQADIDVLNAGLRPTTNAVHTFVLSRNGVNSTKTLSAADVTTKPVFKSQTLDVGGQKVGYMVFNDHIGSAEQPLINAFTQFKNDGINDLVLDLRYNGGGYLFLASQVGYMIAGSTRTTGKDFERVHYNDKRAATKNYAQEFRSQSCIISGRNCTNMSIALPSVNLNRVYVLVSGSTCSASEAIINGLKGIDVEVNIIGKTTCGKPYGFSGMDNCGISYFPIEFEGVNNKGEGGYSDGIAATCVASDDFDHQLGDSNEGMLKAALALRAPGGSCPVAKNADQLDEGFMLRNPLRENRILLDR
jgi:C-terminal processing protease CtpA/Prc